MRFMPRPARALSAAALACLATLAATTAQAQVAMAGSYQNFDVLLEWNSSLVYTTTAAYYATRIAGAPKASRGNGPIETLSAAEVKQLQTILTKKGYKVGKIDGIIGELTREAFSTMIEALRKAAKIEKFNMDGSRIVEAVTPPPGAPPVMTSAYPRANSGPHSKTTAPANRANTTKWGTVS